MKIVLRPLADIKPYEKNPRNNNTAVDAVAESIRRFGFRQPIVVDSDGVIVCGHTRWKAAQKLKIDKVPVHDATDLSPEQIRAYRIADNKAMLNRERGRSRRSGAKETPLSRIDNGGQAKRVMRFELTTFTLAT